MSSSISAPSRRSVVRAAAWTAPAVSIAVAAPAYAACSGNTADATYAFNWERDYRGANTPAPALLLVPGAGTVGTTPVTVTVKSRFGGDMVAGTTTLDEGTYSNLAVSPSGVGGTGTRGLTIMQRAKDGVTAWSTPRSNDFQEVTLEFNRPVRGLQFKLTDIDSSDAPAYEERYWDGRRWRTRTVPAVRQYQDRIHVSGTPTGARATNVTGTGRSATDAWRPTGTNIPHDPVDGANGNVTVTYSSSLTDSSMIYTITYWNDQAGTLSNRALQGVFVTDLRFTAATCA